MSDIIRENGMLLHHCAISVPDMEQTLEWYTDMLGFSLLSRSEIPGEKAKVAHMQGPGFLLEIFEVEGAAPLPKERSHPNTDFRTHGMKHFSIGVKDARKLVEQLQAKGVEVAFVAEVDNTYGAFIRDNAGNLIEVFQL